MYGVNDHTHQSLKMPVQELILNDRKKERGYTLSAVEITYIARAHTHTHTHAQTHTHTHTHAHTHTHTRAHALHTHALHTIQHQLSVLCPPHTIQECYTYKE